MTDEPSAAEDISDVADVLDWLTADITLRPERLRALDGTLRARIRPLVDGVEIDPVMPLRDEDE